MLVSHEYACSLLHIYIDNIVNVPASGPGRLALHQSGLTSYVL